MPGTLPCGTLPCYEAILMLLGQVKSRIMDIWWANSQGFSATLDAIVQNLPAPPQRQTLLFSATQTKSVSSCTPFDH